MGKLLKTEIVGPSPMCLCGPSCRSLTKACACQVASPTLRKGLKDTAKAQTCSGETFVCPMQNVVA